MSWDGYISQDPTAVVEVQPDSTEGLTSIYSITVGSAFFAYINDDGALKYLDEEMTISFNGESMPSTPLYAKAEG